MSKSNTLTRRRLLAGGLTLAAAAATGVQAQQQKPGIPLEVWKDPSCGCCKDWVVHMQANGFAVKVHETGNNGVRAQLGIDMKYASCHTAVVGGYALEGHVPAREVHRLLKEKPQARGLAVPGMPIGSPGMDGSGLRRAARCLRRRPAHPRRRRQGLSALRREQGMKRIHPLVAMAAIGLAAGPVFAQSSHANHDSHAAAGSAAVAAKADMSEGEVRKVDKAAGKVTLKHGPIRNLDMPPMTMVFKATDPKLLDKVKAGDKVRFVAGRGDSGGFTVQAIEPAP